MHLLNDKFNTSGIDPFFYFGLEKNKSIPCGLNSIQIKNHFEYDLKQNPKNLSCHLQRIKFALHEKNHDQFYAALCDLFIILGQQGLALRNRLLTFSKQKLTPEQVDNLSLHLTDENLIANSDFLPENCFFKNEVIALVPISSLQTKKKIKFAENSVHTVESYIENSQFDTAEEYILKHLNLDPENEPLTIKLISLYKALNYNDKFNTAYAQFSNCLLTSRHWDKANNYFLKMNNLKDHSLKYNSLDQT